MRPIERSYTLSGADTTAFGNNIADVNVNGVFYFYPTTSSTPDGVGHQIIITNNNAIDLSSATLTIVGLDVNGQPQTESMDGPDALGTVTSTYYYSSLSYITLSVNDGANTLDLGITGASIELPTLALNWRAPRPRITINPSSGITAYNLQYTSSKIQTVSKNSWIWESETATSTNVYEFANTATTPYAVRIMITTYTDGSTITVQATEADR